MPAPCVAAFERRLLHGLLQRSPPRPQSLLSAALQQRRRPPLSSPRRLQSTFSDQQYPQTQQRSPLTRIARLLAGTTLSLLLGVYLGANLLPTGTNPSTITALISKQPTDPETLDLYTPPDPSTAAINTHILEHPVSKSLRANDTFTESRPHMKIPPALRPSNLTGGTLAGPGKIAVPPLQFVQKDGESLVSIFYLGPQLCGHPGIIHGGLLATLLDEGLARCCFPALPSKIGVTANLRVDYRAPVKAERYYVLRARTERVEGRKAYVRGWIEELGDGSEEMVQSGSESGSGSGERKVAGIEGGKSKGERDPKRRLVEAEALFVEPRNANVIKRIYQP